MYILKISLLEDIWWMMDIQSLWNMLQIALKHYQLKSNNILKIFILLPLFYDENMLWWKVPVTYFPLIIEWVRYEAGFQQS